MRLVWRWLYSWRVPIRILIVWQVILLAVTIGICMVQGRVNNISVGFTLIYLSVGLMTFAVISGVGGLFSTATFEYQFASTISRDILENQRHSADEKRAAFSFVTNTVIICSTSAMLGIFIATA